MKNPIVRLVLVLLALASAGGAGYDVYTLEQRTAALRSAERAFTEDAVRLHATLADIRAAEAGYLATGQDTAVWIEKSAQLRQQADAQLKRLAAAAPTGEAEADLATVGEALGLIGRFDKRIGEVLRDEQPLTASGLIFSDSAQAIAGAAMSLSAARGTRAARTGAAIEQVRKLELYALAGAGAVVLLVLLLLVPAPRPQVSDEELLSTTTDSFRGAEPPLFATPTAMPAGQPEPDADLDLAFERRRARAGGDAEAPEPLLRGTGDHPRLKSDAPRRDDLDVPGAPAAARRDTAAPSGGATAVATVGPPALDLAAAAQLCTDLARVRETSELQGLLARAASLLDASGIVVWMGGAGSDVLWPAFSHGYAPQALSKMQALPRDGGTPVSVAFRKGMMEIVPAGDRTSGAIVAPILTSTGCVGVMAVEIRHGAETSDAEQALASILAAQLATLVAGESQ
jgi:hypothetical protein